MTKTQLVDIAVEMRLAEEIAKEREACAKEADYYAANSPTARSIARAIRARKEGK